MYLMKRDDEMIIKTLSGYIYNHIGDRMRQITREPSLLQFHAMKMEDPRTHVYVKIQKYFIFCLVPVGCLVLSLWGTKGKFAAFDSVARIIAWSCAATITIVQTIFFSVNKRKKQIRRILSPEGRHFD